MRWYLHLQTYSDLPYYVKCEGWNDTSYMYHMLPYELRAHIWQYELYEGKLFH